MLHNIDVLSRNLRAARDGRGWSQDELARRSGISRTHLARIELGLKQPGTGVLVRLANALDISIDRLFSETFTGRIPA